MEKQPDGSWFAICLDLTVHAHGDNQELARENLRGRIHQYVYDALTEDADYIGDLIPRRAPLYFWARYYWYAFLYRCMHIVSNDQTKLFNDHLPLVPA